MRDIWNKKYSRFTIDTFNDKGLDIKAVRRVMRQHRMSVNTIFHERHRSKKGQITFLHHAIETKNVNLINWLLARKTDPNITLRNDYGPPIFVAIYVNDSATVRKLVKLGANLNIRQPGEGYTPLYQNEYDRDVNLAKFMIKNGADVNMEVSKNGEEKGYSPLQIYSKETDIELIKLLLSEGAHVNHKSADGMTPLMCAADEGNFDIFKLLLEHGADVHCQSNQGQTPLIYAAERQNLEMVKLLVDCGADVKCKTTNGYTALINVASTGNVEVIKLLLQHGADVRCKTSRGVTALLIAAQTGNIEIIKLLLENGAEIDCAAECFFRTDIRTPLHYALWSYNIECIEFFFNLYESVTPSKILTGKKRQSLLHYVFDSRYFKSKEIIAFLLDLGIDVDLEDCNKMLAIECSAQHQEREELETVGKLLMMRKHLVKLISANLPVCQRNEDAIGNGLEDFAVDCCKEVNKMKNTKIGDVNTSFYDVLHVSEYMLMFKVKFLRNDSHNKEKLCEMFPMYGGMLFYKLSEAQKRMKRFGKAEEKLAEIFMYCNCPYDFFRELLYYLSESDLRVIVGEKIPNLSTISKLQCSLSSLT